MHIHPRVLDLHKGFRRGPDDRIRFARRGLQRQQVHVRAGIESAQYSIDVDRVGRALVVETLRDHDLEDISVTDELLRPLDGLVEDRCLDARNRSRRDRQVDLGQPGLGGLSESGLHPIEP
jgi:hypothetical protein